MEKIEAVKSWLLSRVGNPYIMGGTGQFCTPSYRRARAAQYPASEGKIIKNCQRLNGKETSCHGCRYYDEAAQTGKRAYDCAQLTRWAMDAIGISLVSGSNSQWLNTPFAEKGEIASLPAGRLCLLFRKDADGKMGHVGVALGAGTAIHARGHDYGVVRDAVSDRNWTHWAIPEGLYGESAFIPLKKGMKGERVRSLQEMLLAAGMLLPRFGADGDYGNETVAAVITFQQVRGLDDSGEVGEATWLALIEAQKQEAEVGEEPPEEAQEPPAKIALQLPREAAKALQEALGRALEG
jgi:hypothetical protein